MDILEYTNLQDYPVYIDFLESGGPVASHYKYITQIKIFNKSDKVYLNYKEVREFLNNRPRLVVSNEKELPYEIYKEFLLDLFSDNITNLNRNFILENTTHEPANFFSLQLGEALRVRFDYLLIHKNLSDFEQYENIIQSIKNLLFSHFG